MCRDQHIVVNVLLCGGKGHILHVNLYLLCLGGWLYFCQFVDLEAKERVMEDMRLALTEQEETQQQMEEVLEEKLNLIQELSSGKAQDLKNQIINVKSKQSLCKECGFNCFEFGVWPMDSLV